MCREILTALPEPEHITGGIDIAVDGKTAGRTGVNTNRKVFRNSVPTLGAELRRVHAGEFLRLIEVLIEDERKFMKQGAVEVNNKFPMRAGVGLS